MTLPAENSASIPSEASTSALATDEQKDRDDLIQSLQAEIAGLREALAEIARGDVPSERQGHYLAHRRAVKLARQALSTASKTGEG